MSVQSQIDTTIIDSHAHLVWDSFQEDQAAVINRAFESGVCQIVHAGVDFDTMQEMVNLAEKYKQIFLAFGLHPHEASKWDQDSAEILAEALGHERAVALGECGLDYYYKHSDPVSQAKAFRAQIALAVRLDKPLIIHSRDAWDETLTILEEEGQGKLKGVFHCFTGGPEVLPRIRGLDFYVSFSGIVTFKKAENVQAAAALVNEDRLLVETDCPYLAPQPFRGKRNEPSYVWQVAAKLAELRSTSLRDIAVSTSANARRLFRLPEPDQT